MRHNKSINHLGRTASHRNAMLSNMATSLILHKRITTTVAKAKALRSYVEPLITKSKVDSTHSRRVVFSYLQNKDSVSELFRDVAVKVASRPGGYTRILKTGMRSGDNAEMCIIELVDYNETYVKETKSTQKAGTRRRRSTGTKKTTEAKVETKTTEVVEEEVKDVVVEEPKTEVVVEEPKADVVEEPKAEVAEEPETPEVKEEPETEDESKNEE